MGLLAYGWTDLFEKSFRELDRDGLEPARVVTENREIYRLYTAHGLREATLSGRLRHQARALPDLPVVGDWVAIDGRQDSNSPARIRAVLPRRTQLSRKAAGNPVREQAVAANLDCALLLMGLDGDYNPRRMERLVITVWESGATPVVLLNKQDLCDEAEQRQQDIEALLPGVPVHLASLVNGSGVFMIHALIHPGKTLVLLGSSGVGKTTLLNRLCGGDRFTTRTVREADQRGRHTTTQRQLVLLPGGGLVMDNPGIREIGLWNDTVGLDTTFADIADLAPHCRFRDCTHAQKPGCAVLEAVEKKALEVSRLDSYRALQQELRYLSLRQDAGARHQDRRRVAAIHRAARKHKPRQ
jgi:ribosome biogenesis GTPase